MASSISLSLCWIWLFVSILRSAASEGQKTITAESGQNVIVECQAPNSNDIIVVEWSRADLKEKYVFLYRDGHIDPTNQHPSFKNRVDLQDRHMKDGDVSLILKNVTINDAGTYECRVFMSGTKNGANRRKRAFLKTPPSGIIYLRVDPPGQTGGDTEDGGKEDGGKEDGGKEDGGKEDGSVGLRRGHFPLIASLSFICAVCILITVKYFYPTRDKATDTQLA